MINVTKTHLPNKEKYKQYIDEIYKNGQITNRGPLVQELEKKLEKYLGVKNLVLVANGTAALQIAYRTLDIKNQAITTPFSFVATTSSLVTNGIEPIFSDINPHTFNINHENIQNLLTQSTEAIVPVHVFGNACNIEEMNLIAKRNNLKIIYDASHAFNVKYKAQSILNYGDISTLSFHATKLFHTIEGGALIINDDALVQKARYLINFGIQDETTIPHLGTNAKMNEFEAAMGLCMLDEINIITQKRKVIYQKYQETLKNIVLFQEQNPHSTKNYSYYPIVFKTEEELLNIQTKLNVQNIYPRRYFNTSLDTLSYIKDNQTCYISRDIAKRILCLPIYPELENNTQELIIKILKENL